MTVRVAFRVRFLTVVVFAAFALAALTTPPGVMASWLEPVYSMPFMRNRFSDVLRPATVNVLPLLVLVPGLFMEL